VINGEPVISAINSTAYAVHHSSGKLKDLKTSSKGSNGITGMTFIDYLLLPANARVALVYNCDKIGEGFMGIQRVQ
jgi:hypothetical protein